MKNIVIVTGATSGVGREFVRQLDGLYFGKIDEIWAVARSEDDLRTLADETYAPVRAFVLDLTDDTSANTIARALGEEEPSVRWLVNSAGTGWFGSMREAPAGSAERAIRLNCLAPTALIEAALPYMGPGSRIVNMSSVAAYLPLPHMGVYAATKAFVLDVTRALNEDLKGTGIHACAVCPKALKTQFWNGAGDEGDVCFLLGTERVYDVVRKAIAAANRGRGAVITAPDMKVACALSKAVPYGVLAALGSLGRTVAAARRTQAVETPR